MERLGSGKRTISHLVFETLGDTDDHVVDNRPDCPEGGNVLPCAMVELDLDFVLLDLLEGDRDVSEILVEFSFAIVNLYVL